MDSLQRNIMTLEREMQISQVNPWKVIGIGLLFVTILGVIFIWWFKPKSLIDNEKDEINYTKSSQFMLALLVACISLLWLFWNMYMFV
jgi:uncharacterized Tic20 family protein